MARRNRIPIPAEATLAPFHITVPAGGIIQILGPGNNLIFEEMSAAFDLERAGFSRETVRARGKFPSGERAWAYASIINRSSTAALTVRGWSGFGDMEVTFNANVSTVIVGASIDLNAGQEQEFPGVDAQGRRRKQFTLTLDPDFAAEYPRKRIRIYNDDTDELLFLVGGSQAGGGIAFETDANLRIQNGYLQNVNSNPAGGAVTDGHGAIAVAEERYA